LVAASELRVGVGRPLTLEPVIALPIIVPLAIVPARKVEPVSWTPAYEPPEAKVGVG
jgi:hypothetical protein